MATEILPVKLIPAIKDAPCPGCGAPITTGDPTAAYLSGCLVVDACQACAQQQRDKWREEHDSKP